MPRDLFAGNISVPSRCRKFFSFPLQLMTSHWCVVGPGSRSVPSRLAVGCTKPPQSQGCQGLVGLGQGRGASPGRFLCLRPAGVSLKSRMGAARDRQAPAEPSGAVSAEERWPRWVPPQPPRSPLCPPDPPSSKPSPTPSSCRRS